uniref:DDE Tnp4 domain-containing protein n=1 Tax=Daphnia galeata TaxID=27404 RepID=A0A8J2WLM9_9CRUS|nr:unnamed protein product [Daphnia galeata]
MAGLWPHCQVGEGRSQSDAVELMVRFKRMPRNFFKKFQVSSRPKGTLSRYPSVLEGTAGVQYRVPRFPARFASIGGPSPLGGCPRNCSAAQEIVLETSKALYKVLAQDNLEPPDTEEWTSLSYEFSKTWNLPNCVGAIDGKHITIHFPANSGSDYYNYNKFFSILLMAMCDAKYRFTLIYVGAYGREGDKQVYSTSEISKSLGSWSSWTSKVTILKQSITPFFVGGRRIPSENIHDDDEAISC